MDNRDGWVWRMIRAVLARPWRVCFLMAVVLVVVVSWAVFFRPGRNAWWILVKQPTVRRIHVPAEVWTYAGNGERPADFHLATVLTRLPVALIGNKLYHGEITGMKPGLAAGYIPLREGEAREIRGLFEDIRPYMGYGYVRTLKKGDAFGPDDIEKFVSVVTPGGKVMVLRTEYMDIQEVSRLYRRMEEFVFKRAGESVAQGDWEYQYLVAGKKKDK